MNLLTEQDEVNKPPVLTSAAAAVAAAVGGNLAHMQWSQSTENCAHTYLTKMVSHLPSACHKHTTNTDIINSEQKKLKKKYKEWWGKKPFVARLHIHWLSVVWLDPNSYFCEREWRVNRISTKHRAAYFATDDKRQMKFFNLAVKRKEKNSSRMR